jgi:hypothetical protein
MTLVPTGTCALSFMASLLVRPPLMGESFCTVFAHPKSLAYLPVAQNRFSSAKVYAAPSLYHDGTLGDPFYLLRRCDDNKLTTPREHARGDVFSKSSYLRAVHLCPP